MSISSSGTRKAGPFSGNGSVTAFPFSFKVFQASDLLVVQTDTTPTDYTLTLNTDYTVALNANQDANPGGGQQGGQPGVGLERRAHEHRHHQRHQHHLRSQDRKSVV